MIKKITDNNFNEVQASKLAIVDFSAVWCNPCKMLEPVLEDLAAELEGSVNFFNADVDANMELAVKYGISSIPAIYAFKNGEMVGQTIGFQPKDALRSFVEAYL